MALFNVIDCVFSGLAASLICSFALGHKFCKHTHILMLTFIPHRRLHTYSHYDARTHVRPKPNIKSDTESRCGVIIQWTNEFNRWDGTVVLSFSRIRTNRNPRLRIDVIGDDVRLDLKSTRHFIVTFFLFSSSSECMFFFSHVCVLPPFQQPINNNIVDHQT